MGKGFDFLNIKIDGTEDIPDAIRQLLPIAASGVKTAINLIRDLSSIWSKDELSEEQRQKLLSDRKTALASLISHQYPPEKPATAGGDTQT